MITTSQDQVKNLPLLCEEFNFFDQPDPMKVFLPQTNILSPEEKNVIESSLEFNEQKKYSQSDDDFLNERKAQREKKSNVEENPKPQAFNSINTAQQQQPINSSKFNFSKVLPSKNPINTSNLSFLSKPIAMNTNFTDRFNNDSSNNINNKREPLKNSLNVSQKKEFKCCLEPNKEKCDETRKLAFSLSFNNANKTNISEMPNFQNKIQTNTIIQAQASKEIQSKPVENIFKKQSQNAFSFSMLKEVKKLEEEKFEINKTTIISEIKNNGLQAQKQEKSKSFGFNFNSKLSSLKNISLVGESKSKNELSCKNEAFNLKPNALTFKKPCSIDFFSKKKEELKLTNINTQAEENFILNKRPHFLIEEEEETDENDELKEIMNIIESQKPKEANTKINPMIPINEKNEKFSESNTSFTHYSLESKTNFKECKKPTEINDNINNNEKEENFAENSMHSFFYIPFETNFVEERKGIVNLQQENKVEEENQKSACDNKETIKKIERHIPDNQNINIIISSKINNDLENPVKPIENFDSKINANSKTNSPERIIEEKNIAEKFLNVCNNNQSYDCIHIDENLNEIQNEIFKLTCKLI